MSEPDRRLVIDLTITEYEDGSRVNEAKLRREGRGNYLGTASRILEAMSSDLPSEPA